MARKDLTDDAMVKPIAMAPFEVDAAMREWCDRWNAEAPSRDMEAQSLETRNGRKTRIWGYCGGLGPPFPLDIEKPQEWARRITVAVFTLIKEA